ncbi:uncharacterized protein C8Q71DRAFT_82310 [Rhodofomes roseus]|uniref:G protein-coupled receptor n=1 Tax=Rhodofomes roseus TaxID=34475 RepID=A0ABQ8KFA2_9APHY|nr:uncharacterized protein C8Q71DRAFT_82310 [Rhodofomes roseus]KAH9836397.1 hypothetical protein C8Q71DRAFT_82310 [Rhodofomes roseus]
MARLADSTRNCVIIIRFEMAGDILILTTSALFTAMRVYALFHKSMYLFAFTLGLGLIAPIISTYSFVLSQPYLYEIMPGNSVCYIETANVTNLDDGCARIFSGLRWLCHGHDLVGHAPRNGARWIEGSPHAGYCDLFWVSIRVERPRHRNCRSAPHSHSSSS